MTTCPNRTSSSRRPSQSKSVDDTTALPPFARLEAPANWRAVELISDLHLDEGDSPTFEAWRRYMASTAADALIILGDLFEVWVGDDAADRPGFAAHCAQVLRETGTRLPVFFMHGNRDFLVGAGLLDGCGVKLLDDPTVLEFAGTRWLLTHGDALCVDDADYVRFRAEVRAPGWQRAFLARPLPERQAIGRDLRSQSETRKRSGASYGDVDPALAQQWLDAVSADVLVPGHTPRPGDHALGARQGIVLSDWDASAAPPRLQVLRLSAAGARRIELA